MRPVTTHKMETVKLKELSFYSYEAKEVLMGLGVPELFAKLFVHKNYWTLLRSMDCYTESAILTGITFKDESDEKRFHDTYEIVQHGSVVSFDSVSGEALVQGTTGLLQKVHLSWLLGPSDVTEESKEAVDVLVPTVVMTDDVALCTLRDFVPSAHSVSFTTGKCVIRLKEQEDAAIAKEETDKKEKENESGKETDNQG